MASGLAWPSWSLPLSRGEDTHSIDCAGVDWCRSESRVILKRTFVVAMGLVVLIVAG